MKEFHYFSRRMSAFLRQNKDDEKIFSIDWLHIPRFHPEIIKDHFKIKSFGFFFSLYQLIKCFLLNGFGKDIEFNNKNISKNINYLFVSHIINTEQLPIDEDFYFGSLSEGKESFTIFINHTKSSDNVINKNLSSNQLLLSKRISTIANSKFLYVMVQTFFIISYKLFFKKNVQKKFFLKLLRSRVITSGTLANHRIKHQIKNIVSKLNPKKVFITFEGHGYEKFIVAGVKEVTKNIECIGYLHSSFFKNQKSLFCKYGSKYDLDKILTTGKIAYNLFLANNFETSKIKVLGTLKYNSIVSGCQDKFCLVAPEGYFSECQKLFGFALEIAILRPDIKFIWRIHPRLNWKFILKKISQLHNVRNDLLPNNITLSNSPLDLDLKKSSYILYRGSTVAIIAGASGLLPIYLKEKNEISIDPLFQIEQQDIKIDNIKQFCDLYDNKSSSKEIKSYCLKLYSKIDFKAIKSIKNTKS